MLNKIARILQLRQPRVLMSYAQCGEDLIINFILEQLGIQRPTYLDIGAHHPTYLSNTYFFYKKGATGVCVEPDPSLFSKIKKARTKDCCLNVGIGSAEGEADFYVMSTRTLNTFSKEDAERYRDYGTHKIEKVLKIPLMTINDIIESRFSSGCPNLISLDVEGWDLEILKSLDMEKYRPEVFCVETLTYTENKSEEKLTDIINFILDKEYLLFADTYINSIFVSREAWARR